MHAHVGFLEFVIFGLYLILWKIMFLVLNLETRRNKIHVPAAVSGLLS